MKVGVVSDTHGLLRPEVEQRLAGVDHIVHAGDIGSPEIVARLRTIAPTTAIRGNIDIGGWAKGYRDSQTVSLAGRSIYILHNLRNLDLDPISIGVAVVISGHSHRPKIETIDGVLYLNPGSAGPRRFTLPIALATLDLGERGIHARIHELKI